MINFLEIKDYRSVGQKIRIEFSVPAENKLGLTVIVGPNSTGKSTIINAVKLFDGNVKTIGREERRNGKGVYARLNVSGELDLILESVDEGSNHIIRPQQVASRIKNNIVFVPSRRHWTDRVSGHPLSKELYSAQSEGFTRDQSDHYFISRLHDISRNKEKTEITNLIKHIFPSFQKWSIDSEHNNTLLVYETGDGFKHDASLFSDGIIGLFRIMVALNDTPSNGTCIIDEPELSLHPQAQKKLAQLIIKFSKSKQIVLTTHSPYFINWFSLSQGAFLYRLHKIHDKETEIRRLKADTVASLNKITSSYQQPQIMDLLSKELFFSEGILFVEGQEDVGLFRLELEKRGIEICFDIFGYGTGGAGNIRKFLQMAQDLNVNAAALYDGNKDAEFCSASNEFTECKILKLSVEDIRDKLEQGKIGMFDKNGVLKERHEEEFLSIINEFNSFFFTRNTHF